MSSIRSMTVPIADDPVLRAENIAKRYPGTMALKGVDFNVYPGKVNVLIGENGAGKSTLMKILAGVEQPSSGRLILNGKPISLTSPRDALRHGIGIIYQELSLFPNLTVSENIFMARELTSRAGTVLHDKQLEVTHAVLARLEQHIDPRTPVEDLRIGQQQLVEIARALTQEVSILIMDEPTSALSKAEADMLLRIIRELTGQGVAVIYISHKLDECLQIGDHFTVLRDGELEAETTSEEVTLSWIVEKMVGQNSDALFHRTKHDLGPTLLEVRNLNLPAPHGDEPLLRNISFTLHAGEIVGIYGLMGAGRTELLESLFGLQPTATGSITLGGKTLHRSDVRSRLQDGMALVPEDRQRTGIVQTMSVAQNMTLASLDTFVRGVALSQAREQEEVNRFVKSLGIKISHASQPISSLSGGNQQKVVVAKNLLAAPKVLMMDEPTRGVDIGAKADIFKIMDELAQRGLGVLFTSSELKEVIAMTDRVLVMSRGTITADLRGAQVNENALVEASVGASTNRFVESDTTA